MQPLNLNPLEPSTLTTSPPPSRSYLEARGFQPLTPIEFEVYKSHAVSEFSVMREAHEAALAEAGHSLRFNSRADAEALRALLDAGLPAGGPLHAQAHRWVLVVYPPCLREQRGRGSNRLRARERDRRGRKEESGRAWSSLFELISFCPLRAYHVRRACAHSLAAGISRC